MWWRTYRRQGYEFCLEQLRVLLIALPHSRTEKGPDGKMMSSPLEPFIELKGL